jgi:hypothetical protein
MRYLSRMPAGVLRALLVASALAAGAPARADAEPGSEHRVAPPPAPEEHPATLSVEIHGGVEVPLERGSICPSGAACALGLGVGMGVLVERRTADRVGLFAGYDFWLVDGGAVFELGTLHALRVGLRYVLDDALAVHPFVAGAVGALAFGSTASVATAGGLLTLGGGVEVELSESVAFIGAAEAWFFSTAPFTTRDRVDRADGFGVNVVLQVTVGISVLVGTPPAVR